MKETNHPRRGLYQSVTDAIVGELEKGVEPWRKPWSAAHMEGRVALPQRHNGIAYRGVNILTLWMAALTKGYAAPVWMTYLQALDLGGAVRKGEKGTLTVYADRITRTATDTVTGEETTARIPFLKGYTVFNVAQIDGLPAQYYPQPAPPSDPLPRIAHAEAYFAALGADLRHGGDRAYYATVADYIQMPPFEAFRDPESYYATLAHEATHWTSHATRLKRDFGGKRFGSDAYAMEELVAELGAAFACATLDLTPAPRSDHASYLDHWLRVLKADKRAIFTAAAHAQTAIDFLNARQPSAVRPETKEAA